MTRPNHHNLTRFKDKLLGLQKRLADQMRDSAQAVADDISAPGDLSNVSTHPADRDSEGLDSEIAVATTEGEILEQVRSALQRIDEGSFGHCVECGQPIPAERLEAVPYA